MDVQKIYRPYTPSRQNQAFLECITTGRKELLDNLLSSVREQNEKPTHQHWMLIGPRGIGKSHIVTLLHNRIKNTPDMKSKWLTIWFPEEAAGIISLRDFMEKALSLCKDSLESEGFPEQAAGFSDLNEIVHEQANDRKALNQIKSHLLDWKEKNRRKILVLLENADRLIGSRIAKNLKDEKWLRDLLMNHDLFLIIGTSPTFFDHLINKDHPLYELFRVEVLQDLSFSESLDLLINYAQAEKRKDLVREFRTRANRIEAIYTLTGGNPRLLIMLYILIQDSVKNINEVETGFYNLLEELTPYFQSRLAQLTAKEEKILVTFAEGAELLTPAEVGRKIRMATNVVTANLKRLQQAGFIKRIEKPIKGRKGTLYRLSETIYRYWYQMNSERNREMADIFIRFIVLYYTYKELEQIYSSKMTGQAEDTKAANEPSEISKDRYYIEKALSQARSIESIRIIKSIQSAIEEGEPVHEIAVMYKELIELNPQDLNILDVYAILLATAGKLEEAINHFRKIADSADETDKHEAYYNWGNALSDLAKIKSDEDLFRESFEKYALAVKYKKDMHEAYNNWGNALADLAKIKADENLFRESFEKYAFAVKYKKDKHEAYNNWGLALADLAKIKADENLFHESFEKYAFAVKYKKDMHEAYYNWGNALLDLAKIKADENLFYESFEKYTLAVKYKKDKHKAYYNWGNALLALARIKSDEDLFRESFEKYALAVKYKKDMHEAYYNWGTALSKLAEMKSDEGLFQESFEKYALAWNLIKKFEHFTHPLMLNDGLEALKAANTIGGPEKQEKAEQIFLGVASSLKKITDFNPVIPHFFDFFISMANKGKIAEGSSYLERLLKTRFKKELKQLMPFRFLFQYLETKDDSVIRRQPPEIQKILNAMIKEIKQQNQEPKA